MFQSNQSYSKNDIYTILNVPPAKQKGTWNTGYTKYNGAIYIFANIGVPGRTGHDYDNHWENSDLVWYGKTNTTIAQPLIQELLTPTTTVHIFTRNNDRDPFIYQGIGNVKDYLDSSPVKVTWSLKNNDLIDPDKAWIQAFLWASKLMDSGASYFSPKKKNEYKITNVTNQKITITRLDVTPQTTEELTPNILRVAIIKINKSQGLLPRTALAQPVAIETAIVEILPQLDWDDQEDNIEINNIPSPLTKTIIEASNDSVRKTINIQLRVRRGQNKLRKNLLHLYQGKCCISNSHIEEVLHACHLDPHSETGNNNSTNALLLRSDIHDLFDANLLGIHPKHKTISLKKLLLGTEYAPLDGKTLLPRTDGVEPDMNALERRWALFCK